MDIFITIVLVFYLWLCANSLKRSVAARGGLVNFGTMGPMATEVFYALFAIVSHIVFVVSLLDMLLWLILPKRK